MANTNSTTITKFADNTVRVVLITDNHKGGVKNLENWCQKNNLILKKLVKGLGRKQEEIYQNTTIVITITKTLEERVDGPASHLPMATNTDMDKIDYF